MAKHRHKRETNARRLLKLPSASVVAGPLAVLVTAPAVALGVWAGEPALLVADVQQLSSASAASSLALGDLDRSVVSRAGARTVDNADVKAQRKKRQARQARQAREVRQAQQAVKRKQAAAASAARAQTVAAVKQADTKLWTTAALNLWTDTGPKSGRVGVIAEGEQVLVTGRREADRAEVVIDRQARWVTASYLSTEEPVAGIGGACTNGTSVASGVSGNIVAVHNAVCAAFPSITVYGTLRGGGGDHPQGRAIDIMVSGSTGWDVANFVRDNASELGVSYVIYSQNIWSVQRGGEGWRGMSSRGSTTADHYDHVHVSTY